MSNSAPSPIGERFGRYVLQEAIGKGGMAEVFRAVSHGVEGFQRIFVIKRILKEKSASKEFIEMFVNEARISALLNHPNIVQIYDFGQINGSYFLTMEHLRGKDLLATLRQLHNVNRLMSPGVAAYIAQQVASGLHYAHSLTQGGGKSLDIVHRDVSPSNIMLLRAGGVKLLDFGIAKAANSIRKSDTTQAGLLKGKLSYLSPEQVKAGAANVDGRSDVFALGVVLWECLTGKRLFFDKTDFQTMRNVMERPVPPPSTQRADLPAALDYIVVRALERDLDRRYPNAKMMVDDLDSFLQDIRYSPAAVPRMLDELFGTDANATETPMPEQSQASRDAAASATRAIVSDVGNPSVSVLPVAVSGAGPRTEISERLRTLLPRTRARKAVWASVAMVLVFAFVIGFSYRQASSSGRTTFAPNSWTPTSHHTATSAPATTPPAPVIEAVQPALPTTVTLKIATDPPGAEVKGKDGASFGVSPVTLTLPRSNAAIPLTISKPGFVASNYMITPDRDTETVLTLEAAAVAAPAGPAPVRMKAARSSVSGSRSNKTRSAGAAGDSDGRVREGLSIDPFAEEPERKKP